MGMRLVEGMGLMGLTVAVAILSIASVSVVSSTECGWYDQCGETVAGALNIHLVPHTHDDVGWLKNVDEYYYGSRKDITPVGVQYILDSVIEELHADPAKKFIYVEMAFFFRWWSEQGDSVRHKVREVVRRRQLEFILGGWSMNDEAAAHYNAIVDQMTWGLKKLNDTFGTCAAPLVAWQIDPFGHSREQANLFAQMGFDGLFFGRLDYADKDKRVQDRTMEMIWKGSDDLGKSSWLFTGALFNGYGPPKGFCFDVFCDDDPIRDNPRLTDYNVDARMHEFAAAARDWASAYATDHVLMPMGEDFNYVSARSWYKNLDKLIRHMNRQRWDDGEKPIHVLYSTPSCYLKSLHESGAKWTTKSDDFFPYASDPHAYWTGYFTSRPTLKGMIRYGNNFLQVCKQIDALTNRDWTPGLEGDLDAMRDAMGVLQHHDAVTGTAKQAVTDDYAWRLARGVRECEDVIRNGYDFLQTGGRETKAPRQVFCHLSNVTECAATEEAPGDFVVTVYNPLVRPVSKHVRFPVVANGLGMRVRAPNGDYVATQVVPVPSEVLVIPGRRSGASHELVFRADLPALGFKSFYVERTKGWEPVQLSSVSRGGKKRLVISNEFVSVSTDGAGNIKSVKADDQVLELGMGLGYYEGHSGHNHGFNDRASGAYIFRPLHQTPTMLNWTRVSKVQGPLVQELHMTAAGGFASQVVRVYEGSGDVEVEWLVGPIPVSDGVGKEVIARYTVPSLKTEGTFYTDSNGRQMIKRRVNKRPTWTLNVTEPVSGNYYPVNSRLSVTDTRDGTRLTVLTDRSQGGTSMSDGEVELMLHRRLLYDDAFGVGEALNESAFGQGLVARGKHWLQVAVGGRDAAKRHRLGAQQRFMDAAVSFSAADGAHMSFDRWRKTYKMESSLLGRNSRLPASVHLMTAEEWHGNSRDAVLLRFEHLFQSGEDAGLSRPVQFDLDDVFDGWRVAAAEEVSLGANLRMGERERLVWEPREDNEIEELPGRSQPVKMSGVGPKPVRLDPMQIRTFIVDLEPRTA